MENNANKQLGSSSSSFTTDLFGSKDSAHLPAPNGTFSSIFPPPSKVLGTGAAASKQMAVGNRQYTGNLVVNKGIAEDSNKNNEGATYCASNKENSIFQERIDTSPLSSALYYGGQEDMYVRTSNSKYPGGPGSYHEFKKEGGENDQNGDNSHLASRGNWWQGSLYY